MAVADRRPQVTLWSDEHTRDKLRELSEATRLTQAEVLRILVNGATARSILDAILPPLPDRQP